MGTYEEIINAALALPSQSRVTLAERLIESLDPEDQERINALWAAEAERRDHQLENGQVMGIPGEEVMERLRDRYKR